MLLQLIGLLVVCALIGVGAYYIYDKYFHLDK